MRRAVIILVTWFFLAMQFSNGAPITSINVGPFDSEAACLTIASFYQSGAVDFFNPTIGWIISDCYSNTGTVYSPNLFQSGSPKPFN